MEFGLVVVWLAAFFGLGLAALPVAALLLGRLPDRGAGVAVPLALVVVTLPAYWVGQVTYGWPALAAGLVVLVAVSAAVYRRFEPDIAWHPVRDTAAVFAVAFLFMVAVRAVDPAVHPIFGEKFLDYGLLKAVSRAESLPPEDFWFAGEPLAYYYGGHLIASLLSILTGTTPKFGYNLALAGYYAMYVTAAFGVGGAIGRARGTGRQGAGLAAAFFVAFASNLATPARAIGGLLPASVLSAAAPEKADTFARGLAEFSYWPASRAMEANVITEFPLFAWLNGDMHAHMMSPPFTLLVVALLLAYYLTPEESVGRRRLLVFGCVPVVGGLLTFVSTWSTFTPAGLVALTLYFAPADPTTLLPGALGRPLRQVAGSPVADGGDTAAAGTGAGVAGEAGGAAEPEGADAARSTYRAALADAERALRTEGVRGAVAAVGALAVLLVGFVFVAPFMLGSVSSREVAFWDAARRSGLGGLLVAHGGFLVVFVAFLRERVLAVVRGNALRLLGAVSVLFVVGVVHGFAAFGLVVPLLLVGWLLLRDGDTRPTPTAEPQAAPAPDGGGTGSDPDGGGTGSDPDADAVTGSGTGGTDLDTALRAGVNGVQTLGVNLLLLVAAYLVVDVVVGVALSALAGVLGTGTTTVLAPVLTLVGTVGVLFVLDWPAIWVDPGSGTPKPVESPGDDVGFETLLLIAGAGLVLIVEVVYVVEFAAPGRFNTVFKTYSQVWGLWAVAAGVMLVATVGRHLPAAAVRGGSSDGGGDDGGGGGGDEGSGAGTDDGAGPSLQARFAVGASVLLVLSLSLYGGLAMTNHFTGNSVYPVYQRTEDPTLDATAFLEEGHPEEAPAIRWLDRREGTPVIVTAPGLYRWQPADGKGSNAPASLTGLPTVVGWPHHERGFRGPDAGVGERVADVDAIYTGTVAERACGLAEYDVRYVYVGPAERNQYGEESVDGLGDVPGVDVEKTFSDGAVVIYGVDQSELPAGNC